VESLEALYATVRAVWCPILVAGGTRIKILEAAAYGKAVVSTSEGAEGLDVQDGIHVLLRDRPEGLAESRAAVLTDDDLCQRLGIDARKRVAAACDRSVVVEKARQEVSSVLNLRCYGAGINGRTEGATQMER
jgi:glycosyltransferase involved in cell wall biosynthesis